MTDREPANTKKPLRYDQWEEEEQEAMQYIYQGVFRGPQRLAEAAERILARGRPSLI